MVGMSMRMLFDVVSLVVGGWDWCGFANLVSQIWGFWAELLGGRA